MISFLGYIISLNSLARGLLRFKRRPFTTLSPIDAAAAAAADDEHHRIGMLLMFHFCEYKLYIVVAQIILEGLVPFMGDGRRRHHTFIICQSGHKETSVGVVELKLSRLFRFHVLFLASAQKLLALSREKKSENIYSTCLTSLDEETHLNNLLPTYET